jgi:hypothetical protein
VRNWLKQADVDEGKRPEASAEEHLRIRASEWENREQARPEQCVGGCQRRGLIRLR